MGKLWIRFLCKWYENGWGNGKNMDVNLTGKIHNINLLTSEPVKVNLDKKYGKRVSQFSVKPKVLRIFKHEPNLSEDSTRLKYFEKTGDICIEMSLAFVFMACRYLKLGLSINYILDLVKDSKLPYLFLADTFDSESIRELNEVQLNNTQNLFSFFSVSRIPSKGIILDLSHKISSYLDLNIDIFGKVPANLDGYIQRFLSELQLPLIISPVVSNAINIKMKRLSYRSLAKMDTEFHVHLAAVVIFVLKCFLPFDDSFRVPSRHKASQKSAMENGLDVKQLSKKAKVRYVLELESLLKSIPQPDGQTDHHNRLYGSFGSSKNTDHFDNELGRTGHMDLADQMPRMIKTQKAENELKHDLEYDGFDRILDEKVTESLTGDPARTSARYIRYDTDFWHHEAYGVLLKKCAEFVGVSSSTLAAKVSGVECEMDYVERVLRIEESNLLRMKRKSAEVASALNLGHNDEFEGFVRVDQFHKRHFLRVWRRLKDGKVFFDCFCGESRFVCGKKGILHHFEKLCKLKDS